MCDVVKVVRLTFVWLVLVMMAVACGEEPGPQATATEIPAEPSPLTPEVEATATEIPAEPTPPTATASAGGETPSATQPPATPTEAEATAEVTPEVEVTATATITATGDPVTGTEYFAPGQQATVTLADGEFATFPFSGAALETLLFFAEPDDDLNVDLAVYEAGVTAESDLSSLTPLVAAGTGAAGVPEVLVFVPDDDGDFSLVVPATGEGEATVHFFDVETQGTANTLAAGEVSTGQFYSNISRPVLIFADPVETADIIIRATTAEGEVLAESNFGGPGAAEVLFMLPPQPAGFNFEISEATGAAGGYELVVISLE